VQEFYIQDRTSSKCHDGPQAEPSNMSLISCTVSASLGENGSLHAKSFREIISDLVFRWHLAVFCRQMVAIDDVSNRPIDLAADGFRDSSSLTASVEIDFTPAQLDTNQPCS
jgi:hypothetical protein